MIRVFLCFAILVIAGHAGSGKMASLVRPVSAQDSSASVESIRGRAISGDAHAQYQLGRRYADGDGIGRNLEEAFFWLAIAADGGIAAAAAERDAIGAALRASAFVRAQSRLRDWRGGIDRPAPGAAEARPTRPARTSTGTVVGAERILTSRHGIAGCGTLTLQGAASGSARVLAKDGDLDLALLAVDGNTLDAARFRTGEPVVLGIEVVVFGYPLQGLLAYGANVTTGIVSGLAGPRNDTRLVQFTAPVQPGNSGGPLLDRSGAVIGIVVSKINALKVAQLVGDVPQNINFALRGAPVRRFLASHGVSVAAADSGPRQSVAEIAARAARFTVLIECWQ